ncbi:MAG: hypothetical protein NXI10_07875 [bacterium]|nr:hypothetical protein [bacterium]
MKKLLLLPLLGSLLLGCNFASDDDYDNMAEEMCDCWQSINDNVSRDFKTAMVEAADEGEDLQVTMQRFQATYPRVAQNDLNAIAEIESADFNNCLTDIETKYNEVYSTDSEEQRQKKLLSFIKKKKNCEVLYAFAKYEMYME